MAYQSLGTAFVNAGDEGLEAEYKRKAFSLIDRVSDREQHSISAGYYESTGELDKAIDAYRAGIGSYPRFWEFQQLERKAQEHGAIRRGTQGRPSGCGVAAKRGGPGPSSIRGFIHRVEGRRHRYPDPSTSQGGVREAAMTIGARGYLSVPGAFSDSLAVSHVRKASS